MPTHGSETPANQLLQSTQHQTLRSLFESSSSYPKMFHRAIWLIGSFVVFMMLAFFIIGHYHSRSTPTTPVPRNLMKISTSGFEYTSTVHRRILNQFEARSQYVRQKCRSISGHTSLLYAKRIHSIHKHVNHTTTRILDSTYKIYQSVLVNAIHPREQEDKGKAENLSNLHLANEYHLLIPTTCTNATLNTAVLHKAYSLLTAVSVQFCQLGCIQRCAAVRRIAQEIIVYSDAMGHVWSMENTFKQAAQLLQSQSHADWFERFLGLQTMEFDSVSGEEETDFMANFIAIVFFLTCGFPAPARIAANAINHTKAEIVEIGHQLEKVDGGCHTSSSFASYLRETRSKSQPGYTKQWHTLLQE